MTSRIELRKEQQRQVSTNTPSIGWVAGEAVVTIDKPHINLLQPDQELLVTDNNFSVNKLREDSTPEAIDLSTEATTTTGITIKPRSPKDYWKNVGVNGSPEFMEFRSKSNINQVYISLESGNRPTVTRTITTTSPTSYTETIEEKLAVWTPPNENFFSVDHHRLLGTYSNITDARRARDALRSLGDNRIFGSLVRTYSLNLDRGSTKENELRGNTNLQLDGTQPPLALGISTRFNSSESLLRIGTIVDRNGTIYENTQITGYVPAKTRIIRGSTTSRSTVEEIVEVVMSIQFIDANDNVVETKNITIPPEITTLQTFNIVRTSATNTPTIKVSVGIDGEHNAWLRTFVVPLPRQFSNASTQTYIATRSIDVGAEDDGIDREDTPIQLFGHASPINVPFFVASLAGTRPNEYLTYSGTWDGTTFQQLRCRCPAWILYDVLTKERFGIELATNRINTQSFLIASKYCQALINGKPRWSYDGLLQGTQSKIIRDLLNLMRGWLRNDVDGRLSLKIEQPEEARWIICPAVIGQGRIDYRRSLERPTVRCTYRDRLTGQELATAGLENSRIVEVPWQDPDVAQRWADWETFNDQNLLDSVEFTLPWRYHSIGIGDLIDLYDPQHIGLRPAGRILDFDATGKWVQLDGVPNYWPDKEASASLKDYGRKTVIDPDVWGFSTFSFTGANPPSVQIQTEDGGYTSHAIKEVMFSAGGRPEQNRVILDTFPANIEDRATWAISGKIDGDATEDIHPTKWRVQSITENDTGREFKVVCTRYIDGMHNFIEAGVAFPDTKTKWRSKCGTNLSQYDGFFADLEQRYPADNTDPFDLSTTFSNLPSSCVM